MEFLVQLIAGAMPVSMASYRMTPAELKEFKVQLQDLLDKGYIRPSLSPWGAPILFLHEKNGTFRMCID